jgi:uncharacterized membrane protein
MRARVRILGYAALAACPIATHALLAMGYSAQVVAALYALQVIVLGVVLTARATYIYKWWLLGAGAVAFSAVAFLAGRYSFFAAAGIPYVAAYVTLLAIFGASLQPGREPVITALSRRIHGGVMRPDVAVYTRRVTIAWCCFFAGQLIVSLALFFFASEVAWSFYVNVLDLPLIAVMFGAEYLYRLTHLRDWPHSTVAQVIRAFSQRKAAPAKPPKPAGPNPAELTP